MGLQEDAQEMVEQLLEKQEDFNDFERKFMESMVKCFDNAWPLSQKQQNKLAQIHAEKVLGKKTAKKGADSIPEAIENGRVSAERSQGAGYVVHVDGKEYGDGLVRREAMIVVSWLGNNLEDLLALEELPLGDADETGIEGDADEDTFI